MGVMMAPEVGSGRCPACTARVPHANLRSSSKMRDMRLQLRGKGEKIHPESVWGTTARGRVVLNARGAGDTRKHS